LGNHIFLDSGLLRTFDQLEKDDIGAPAKSWVEDYFFDTAGVRPAERIAERALELTLQSDRRCPQAWATALFASQHELFTDRKLAAQNAPLVNHPAARVRAIARWVLPHGMQLQLRQARARRRTRNMRSAGLAETIGK
jgi:hypothetical protein